MLQIKLSRIGKKKMPTYRLVILEKGRDPYGNTLEILGNYNPRLKTKAFKTERVKYWISKGAQPSPTVHNMLVSENIISGAKVKAWRPKARAAQEAKPSGEQLKEAKSEEENYEGYENEDIDEE